MITKKDIISKRYLNDGIPLVNLKDIQKKYLGQFLDDRRVEYKIISHCPICKSEDYILIAEKDRYAVPLETVICQNCGLIRSYKQLDNESLKIFYSEYYRKIDDPINYKILDERYKREAKRKILKYVTKDKVIMEIGCGGGWNLSSFLKAGYKHYGFDFDKEFIDYGREKGLNLYLGGVKEAKEMGIKADYLLIDQVLEHVENPIDFLKSLKPLLNDKAIVNIYVPSLDLLLWGYTNYDLLGTLQFAHNFLFDEFILKIMATFAGFKIINCVANNLVLENSQNITSLPFNYSKLDRGKKIVKYLKFVEKTLFFRNKIGIEKIIFKKFYCISNPIGCYKRFFMEYFGKI